MTASKILSERTATRRVSLEGLVAQALRLELLLQLLRVAVEAVLHELLARLLDVRVRDLDAEVLGGLLELGALDEERDVLLLDALVLGRTDLRELALLRLVARLRLLHERVELGARDLGPVDHGDGVLRNVLGASAPGRDEPEGSHDGREHDE